MTALLPPTSRLGCPPRWSTSPTPGRATLGGRVGEIAAMLGTPLMGWQQHVADVALEVDPDSGQLAYREIRLTVPRQSGKTTLMLAVMVHRALGFNGRQRITYTAQTRLKARQKWEDEHVVALKASPLRSLFTVRLQIGQEAIRWRNGSLHGLEAPSDDIAHGDVLDLGAIDEAFAQEDDRVEQGMKPAMITRQSPQLWISRPPATRSRMYLREKVDRAALAAAGILAGSPTSSGPLPDADPVIRRRGGSCMPALGITARAGSDRRRLRVDEAARVRAGVPEPVA